MYGLVVTSLWTFKFLNWPILGSRCIRSGVVRDIGVLNSTVSVYLVQLSSTSSYFIRDHRPVRLILCFRRSTSASSGCITHQVVVVVHHALDVRELAVQVVDAPPLALVGGVAAHALVLVHDALLYALWAGRNHYNFIEGWEFDTHSRGM